MKYTVEQLRNALNNEYEWMCHEGIEEGELTPEQYATKIETMNYDELLYETMTDEWFTLDEFMSNYES